MAQIQPHHEQSQPGYPVKPDLNADGIDQWGQGLILKQETSECCRCFTCQPNIHWSVHNYKHDYGFGDELPQKMYITEDADYCGRVWSCASVASRQTKYTVYPGGAKGVGEGQVIMTHEKDCSCPVRQLVLWTDSGPVYCPCCNFCPGGLPYLRTVGATGELLGRSQYVCDIFLCVPRFDLYDASGINRYRVRPETCCCGCCVMCRCGGTKGKMCHVPFFIRRPQHPYQEVEAYQGFAQVCDLWAGWKNECCTNRNAYAIQLPKEIIQHKYSFAGNDQNANIAATILGMALLIDICVFEQEHAQ